MATRALGDAKLAEAILDRVTPESMDEAEVVRGEPARTAGTSLRLSLPLLQILDEMAGEQHRTRSNLIQHILWDYVRSKNPHRV